MNGTLYIGHEPQALTPNRTFGGLYIEPLVNILMDQNPKTPFTQQLTLSPAYPLCPRGSKARGVFDRDGGQTLYLFVDVKTDGFTTWPYVVQALEPLREKGWLTRVNGTTIINGPITVVGTGNSSVHFTTDLKEILH